MPDPVEHTTTPPNSACPSRGVALLLVLILLIAIAAIGPLLLSRAWSAGTDASLAFQRQASATLADDTAIAIAQWLSTAQEPGEDDQAPLVGPGWIAVADHACPSSHSSVSRHDASSATGSTIQPLRHRAWILDLNGRVHVRHAGTFAADAIPAALTNALDREAIDRAMARRTNQTRDTPPLPPPLLESLLQRGSSIAMFPDDPDQPADSDTALISWWTSHGSGALNIAAAPFPVLEAALLGLDPLHTSAVLDARRAGQAPPAQNTTALIRARSRQIADEDATRLIPLTDRPGAIGVLVETTFAGHTDRTWFVLTPPEPIDNRIARQPSRRAGNRSVESGEPSRPWQVVLRQTVPARRPSPSS